MSYIRTKNGVYEVIKNKLGECIKIDGGFVILEDVRLIEQNIRESDNLTELCDEFVYYNPKTQIEKYRYEYYHNLSEKDHDLKWLKEGKIIYGAIWTLKGLIFVAKMNEKGELVLI